MKSIFEILMLVCFGAAWPFSIYKSATAREVGSKSLLFLLVIFVGYVAGILHKVTTRPDYVIALYALNGVMVLTDFAFTVRNRIYHIRSSARDAAGHVTEAREK